MQSTTLNSRKGQVSQHWRGVLPVHPAAELLPRMSDTELNELGDDIRRRGLQTPIAILVGEDGTDRLLDGISRLDAMELVGLPVVVDGELNSEIVPTQNVAGNVDPVGYVLSANVHRRHLTGEQKRALIEKVLKVKPEQSDRTTAKQVKADHKTVGKVRDKLEARGEIPHAKTRTDTKGRKQPARKPGTKTAGPRAPKPVAKKPEVQEPKQEPHAIAATLDYHLNALLALCERESVWPPLNSGRKARRIRALKKLRAAWSELVELAKPARPRGRPPKARAS
jgi:hypothetical protein